MKSMRRVGVGLGVASAIALVVAGCNTKNTGQGCTNTACPSAETCCMATCVDLKSDPVNCGACGHACAVGACFNGSCAVQFDAGGDDSSAPADAGGSDSSQAGDSSAGTDSSTPTDSSTSSDASCPGVVTEAGCNPVPLVNRTSGTSNDLHAVGTTGSTPINGLSYVGGGEKGTLVTSADGKTWTATSLGTMWANTAVESVAIGATATNKFVVVAASVYGLGGNVVTSPDASTWAQATGTGAPTQAVNVVWTGTQYVTVGTGGEVTTSPDGATWTAHPQGSAWNGFFPASTIWTGSTLVTVGGTSSSSFVATSTDGATWTVQGGITSATTQSLWTVSLGGSTLVASGNGTTSNPSNIVTSIDQGQTWTPQPGAGTALAYLTSGYTGSFWVFMGMGTGIYSSDSTHWQPLDVVNNSTMEGTVTGGPLQLVSVGTTGAIVTTMK